MPWAIAEAQDAAMRNAKCDMQGAKSHVPGIGTAGELWVSSSTTQCHDRATLGAKILADWGTPRQASDGLDRKGGLHETKERTHGSNRH